MKASLSVPGGLGVGNGEGVGYSPVPTLRIKNFCRSGVVLAVEVALYSCCCFKMAITPYATVTSVSENFFSGGRKITGTVTLLLAAVLPLVQPQFPLCCNFVNKNSLDSDYPQELSHYSKWEVERRFNGHGKERDSVITAARHEITG